MAEEKKITAQEYLEQLRSTMETDKSDAEVKQGQLTAALQKSRASTVAFYEAQAKIMTHINKQMAEALQKKGERVVESDILAPDEESKAPAKSAKKATS